MISKLKTLNILRAAISKWGEKDQMRMVSEECSELSAAENQYCRGKISRDDLAGEIADVTIMVQQARMIIGDDLVDIMIDKKMKRLARLLGLDVEEEEFNRIRVLSREQALERIVELESTITSLQKSTRSAIEKERIPRH